MTSRSTTTAANNIVRRSQVSASRALTTNWVGARKHVARRGGDLDAIGEGWIAIFASVLEDLANLGKLGGLGGVGRGDGAF